MFIRMSHDIPSACGGGECDKIPSSAEPTPHLQAGPDTPPPRRGSGFIDTASRTLPARDRSHRYRSARPWKQHNAEHSGAHKQKTDDPDRVLVNHIGVHDAHDVAYLSRLTEGVHGRSACAAASNAYRLWLTGFHPRSVPRGALPPEPAIIDAKYHREAGTLGRGGPAMLWPASTRAHQGTAKIIASLS